MPMIERLALNGVLNTWRQPKRSKEVSPNRVQVKTSYSDTHRVWQCRTSSKRGVALASAQPMLARIAVQCGLEHVFVVIGNLA